MRESLIRSAAGPFDSADSLSSQYGVMPYSAIFLVLSGFKKSPQIIMLSYRKAITVGEKDERRYDEGFEVR